MILFNLKNKKLSPINPKLFGAEKEIQSIVESNTEEIFDLRLVCSEFSVGQFRFDSVCFDEESKSFVIIEYKKDHSFSIIDQGFSYLSTMLQNKAEFILEYNEIYRKSLKKRTVDWSQSRIIFISPSFTAHQKNSINFKDMPFELWEVNRFANNLITFSQFLSSSKESLKGISKNSLISKVSKEIKTYDTSDLLSKSSSEVKKLWQRLNQRISKSDFQSTKLINRQNYIRFCYENNAIICYFNFRKNEIKIDIIGGTVYRDGTKGRYFLELNDYKNLTKKKKDIWKGYGEKRGTKKDPVHFSYEIRLSDEKNISYFIELIQQRYEAIVNNI